MSAIGVDVGGSKLLAVRIEGDGAVVDESRAATPDTGEMILSTIVGVVRELTDGADIVACGVGIAGLVDHDTGTLVWSPHVTGVNLAVRERLEMELGTAAVVDNDANVSALAEHRLGAGRGSRVLLMLTLGTGIGGAIVFGGEVFRGKGFAGEFGHTRLVDSVNECDCGRQGCWETAAAGPALERMAQDLIDSDPAGSLATSFGGNAVGGPALSAAALAGDSQAIDLINRVGRAFGEGLASLITIFDPDRIVVGGGLGSIGETILEPIRLGAEQARYGAEHTRLPPIVGAELGERAGAVGAGLLALDMVGARG